jgi:uncharacterized protein (TIGR03067 family)
MSKSERVNIIPKSSRFRPSIRNHLWWSRNEILQDQIMRLHSFRPIRRRWKIVAAVGIALAIMLYSIARVPRGDAARFQGNWSVVAVEDSGVAVNEPFLKTRQYIFDGNKAIVRARGGPVAASWVGSLVQRHFQTPSFKLDPTATPKAIDLVLPDYTTMRGIYDIDGDRLKICFSGPSDKAAMMRPTGFSVPGSGARLVILKRDGK